MLGDELLQLADDLGVVPERELGLDTQLERGGAQLLQSRDGRLRVGRIRDVGERRTAPQRQRRVRVLRRRGGIVGQCGRGAVQSALEALEVELAALDQQRVAGRARDQPPAARTHRLAQLRHPHAERRRAGRGLALAPQRIHQPVRGDDLPRVQEQEGQQLPLPRPADRHLGAVLQDLERPEQPELHSSPARYGLHTHAADLMASARVPQPGTEEDDGSAER
jgi:hypothetical protein